MLCTMCCRGIDSKLTWVCHCAERHCQHINYCPDCQISRRTLTLEGNPDGRPRDIEIWRAGLVKVPVKVRKKRPKKVVEFVCPKCAATHTRGAIDARNTYRCYKCGETVKIPYPKKEKKGAHKS